MAKPLFQPVILIVFILTAVTALEARTGPDREGTPDPAVEAHLDPDLLAGMKARSVGPATMSGRVASIDAVTADPDLIYAGVSTGGLWKSENGGLTWRPVFDDQAVAAVGAVAIFQPSPDLVWVGTGEGNPRNSASVGNGVYKTLDGGRTWTHLGLDGTERIHRIALHPSDPDVAYVAALGSMWGENAERGVFRTVDGGKTWEKVLFVDEQTGCADLVMDPGNPRKLIAAMWTYRRWPWFFKSGGPGSGIYITYDGGDNWKRLTRHDGLPEGEIGRAGLAVARSDPKVVYALVEAESLALYKSADGGETWGKVSEDRNVGNRPFYYADLRVDPKNPDRVYSLWSLISVSRDGGRTFEVLVPFRDVHPDHHTLWIHPEDPTLLINGNDGGIYLSRDRGRTWRFAGNLPVGQYYHVRVDMDLPYNIYGGMQDNGSWRGPSQVWETGGIRNFHWRELDFGDGFDTLPYPDDSSTGYAMSQEGFIVRWNLRTGERKDIRPAPPEGVELRFNWNAALAQDPFDPAAIYFGSQFVHRSGDRGETWTVISPDLTTNNPEWQKQDESGGLTYDVTGAENFTTLVAIAPSPIQQGLIWTGSDDGRLHLTRDGGGTWASLEEKVPGVPANTWIPHITPSKFDAAEAFVVFDDHRRSNWTPYVYHTRDYGETWTNLATDEISGYALAVDQDPVDRDLLFLGTEFGLYLSLDAGGHWFKWTHGVPTVSVMDLVAHPRDHDLVLGTHGRSAYVLDDISPLRELGPEVQGKPLHLFAIPGALQHRVARAASTRMPGHGEFRGENRPYGALISYWMSLPDLPHPNDEKERLREGADGAAAQEGDRGEGSEEEAGAKKEKEKSPEVTIEITDSEGKVIRTFEAPARLGLNRTVWNLRRDAFKRPPDPEQREDRRPEGPEVPPGVYGVKVKYGEHAAEGVVAVAADPRSRVLTADRRANHEAVLRAGALQETVTEAVERIRKTREDIEAVLARMEKEERSGEENEEGGGVEAEDSAESLKKAAGSLKEGLDRIERLFRTPPDEKGIRARKHVSSKISYALRALSSSWDEPTAAQQAYLDQAEAALEEALQAFNRFFEEAVAPFREKVRQAGITLFPEMEDLKK